MTQEGGYLNAKDYELLADFICTRFDSCENCPLVKYADCDIDAPERELVSAAKKLRDAERKDSMAWIDDDKEEKAVVTINKYMNGVIV